MFHLRSFDFTLNFLFHSKQNSDSVSKTENTLLDNSFLKQKSSCWIACVVNVKDFIMTFSSSYS
eukprot:TRINITY_DN3312_c1_g1_i10.p1 TRINITY_DN3312_c1_g1~~TRINITY_DN3312_c1_g1_i10.p1  ORF type:complete len:64 (+),score=8.12 TRINITY_DN3312_c1_g1_i10:3-194(+)